MDDIEADFIGQHCHKIMVSALEIVVMKWEWHKTAHQPSWNFRFQCNIYTIITSANDSKVI